MKLQWIRQLSNISVKKHSLFWFLFIFTLWIIFLYLKRLMKEWFIKCDLDKMLKLFHFFSKPFSFFFLLFSDYSFPFFLTCLCPFNSILFGQWNDSSIKQRVGEKTWRHYFCQSSFSLFSFILSLFTQFLFSNSWVHFHQILYCINCQLMKRPSTNFCKTAFMLLLSSQQSFSFCASFQFFLPIWVFFDDIFESFCVEFWTIDCLNVCLVTWVIDKMPRHY
jgi:hypothetical protein